MALSGPFSARTWVHPDDITVDYCDQTDFTAVPASLRGEAIHAIVVRGLIYALVLLHGHQLPSVFVVDARTGKHELIAENVAAREIIGVLGGEPVLYDYEPDGVAYRANRDERVLIGTTHAFAQVDETIMLAHRRSTSQRLCIVEGALTLMPGEELYFHMEEATGRTRKLPENVEWISMHISRIALYNGVADAPSPFWGLHGRPFSKRLWDFDRRALEFANLEHSWATSAILDAKTGIFVWIEQWSIRVLFGAWLPSDQRQA